MQVSLRCCYLSNWVKLINRRKRIYCWSTSVDAAAYDVTGANGDGYGYSAGTETGYDGSDSVAFAIATFATDGG